jgi:hypothetical protein
MFPSVQNSTQDVVAILDNDQSIETPTGSGGVAFMKFDFNTGRYFFGVDKEEITNAEICVNTASFQHGWTVWANNKPTKVSCSISRPLPERIPAVGANEPTESRSFQARFLDADDDTILEFSTNSFGGRKGTDELKAIIKLRAAKGEKRFLFPIVELTSTSYVKLGKTIHNPVFKVVGWLDAEGIEQGEEVKIEAPKKPVSRAKAEPVEEVEVEEVEEAQAPVRRRRRA